MGKIGSVVVLCALLSLPSTPSSEHKVATTTTTTSTTTTTLVAPHLMEQWSKVAWCETHGHWAMQGPHYSGGLGIRNDVWVEYGGLQYAEHAGDATVEQQIIIARRINSNGYIPDQNGTCKRW